MCLSSKIEQGFKARLPQATALLRDLIRMPSAGTTRDVLSRMAGEFEKLGLDVQQVSDPCAEGRALGIVARIKGSRSGDCRSLALNAHADIAPVERAESWRHPPFEGVVADGWIWGRGAQDDRAGLVLQVMIAGVIRELGLDLQGDVIFQVALEEETSAEGSKAIARAGFTGDGTVVLDGTWPNRIVHAHLGQVSAVIGLNAVPGAAGNVHRLLNPIDALVDLITALRDFAGTTLDKAPSFCGLANNQYLNIGRIEGGCWAGAVPETARMEAMIGFAPPWTSEAVLDEIAQRAKAISPLFTISPGPIIREPFAAEPDGSLIRTLKTITEEVTGKETPVIAISGYTDMAFLQSRDICLYGPGGGENAHGRDERFRLADLALVGQSVLRLAMDWCGRLKEE